MKYFRRLSEWWGECQETGRAISISHSPRVRQPETHDEAFERGLAEMNDAFAQLESFLATA